jgi:hypothetical protein
MFRTPPFVPVAAGVGVVLFTIFAILAPLDTWWPLLEGPTLYQQILTETRFVPLQPYVDDGCPWRSVVAWRRLREAPEGSARFRAVFSQAGTPAARILAAAGLLGRDSVGWTAAVSQLSDVTNLGLTVHVLPADDDMIRDLPIDTLLALVKAGTLTRQLEAVDLRERYCWVP